MTRPLDRSPARLAGRTVARAALPLAVVAVLATLPLSGGGQAASPATFDPMAPLTVHWKAVDSSTPTVTAHVVGFNDIHGYLDPSPGLAVQGQQAGGAAYLTKLVQARVAAATAAGQPSVVASAGDNIGASPINSAAGHDEGIIDALDAGIVDPLKTGGPNNTAVPMVSAVGNHEFDEGTAELQRVDYGDNTVTTPGQMPYTPVRTDGCNSVDNTCYNDNPYTGAEFPYLSANVVDHNTQRPLFQPYVVETLTQGTSSVKVAFIGETLQGTAAIVNPNGIQGIDFLPEAATANKYVQQLSATGVNAFVLVIHQGGTQYSTQPVPAAGVDPTTCANYAGDITGIVSQLDPKVKVVVSGHTHRFYNCALPLSDGTMAAVTSAGNYGTVVSDTTFTVDASTGMATSGQIVGSATNTNTVALNGGVKSSTGAYTYDPTKRDTNTQTVVATYDQKVKSVADAIVGRVNGDLTTTATASGETSMGDTIADGMVFYSKTASPDLALMNPGGVRNNIIANSQYDAGDTETPGDVVYGECFLVQPFNNLVVTVSMTGAQLKTILEQQFTGFMGQTTQKILPVSSGVVETYDPSAALGSRIIKLTINGAALDPAKTYRVTTNDFLANGGDGFTGFTAATSRTTQPKFDVDALAAWISNAGSAGLNAPALGRISTGTTPAPAPSTPAPSTAAPTVSPTAAPTAAPTVSPTVSPTVKPTPTPTPTASPVVLPASTTGFLRIFGPSSVRSGPHGYRVTLALLALDRLPGGRKLGLYVDGVGRAQLLTGPDGTASFYLTFRPGAHQLTAVFYGGPDLMKKVTASSTPVKAS